jgi:hypothetical protein
MVLHPQIKLIRSSLEPAEVGIGYIRTHWVTNGDILSMSPDASRLLMRLHDSLWLTGIDGTGLCRLHIPLNATKLRSIAWHPSGSKLLLRFDLADGPPWWAVPLSDSSLLPEPLYGFNDLFSIRFLDSEYLVGVRDESTLVLLSQNGIILEKQTIDWRVVPDSLVVSSSKCLVMLGARPLERDEPGSVIGIQIPNWSLTNLWQSDEFIHEIAIAHGGEILAVLCRPAVSVPILNTGDCLAFPLELDFPELLNRVRGVVLGTRLSVVALGTERLIAQVSVFGLQTRILGWASDGRTCLFSEQGRLGSLEIPHVYGPQ